MAMRIRNMTVTALGLVNRGVRVQIESDTALMAADLSRESAVNHAAYVLELAGIASITIAPDGSYQAVERSN
jgi:hypothetical protein